MTPTKSSIDQALAHPIQQIRIVRKFNAEKERTNQLGLRKGPLTILRDARAYFGQLETKRLLRSRAT